jgi:hypothetical protein
MHRACRSESSVDAAKQKDIARRVGSVTRSSPAEAVQPEQALEQYKEVQAQTLDECKARCGLTKHCLGIEYGGPGSHTPGRCELWFEHIAGTSTTWGYICLRVQMDTGWHFVDGGANRACRLRHQDQGRRDSGGVVGYYAIAPGHVTLETCKQICVKYTGCRGVGHDANGVCKIWHQTPTESTAETGSECLTYTRLDYP